MKTKSILFILLIGFITICLTGCPAEPKEDEYFTFKILYNADIIDEAFEETQDAKLLREIKIKKDEVILDKLPKDEYNLSFEYEGKIYDAKYDYWEVRVGYDASNNKFGERLCYLESGLTYNSLNLDDYDKDEIVLCYHWWCND